MSDCYRFSVPGLDLTFEVDRLRRDCQDLLGELTVRCGLPGAKTINGCLSTGDFNFSSVRARQERAKFLAQRAGTNGKVDWLGLLEDFCQRVFEAERTGDPFVRLRDLPRPERGDDIIIHHGLTFPRRHPSIIFGDGGAAKSYTALYLGGLLAYRGLSIALFDWELCGEDHRDRYERLFGVEMPESLWYRRCERPLMIEVDSLRAGVRQHKIDFAIFDSVAFACDGPPEAAEVASRYFRAVREIGVGSLHIAHVNRSEHADQKPFGSTFWHNGARSTWFVQAAESVGDDKTLRLGFFNRKANLGPIHRPVGYLVNFSDNRTEYRRVDVADTPELAEKLTIRQRMQHLLKRGARTPDEIATALDVKVDSVRKVVDRDKQGKRQCFLVLEGGRVGLKEQSA